MDLKCNKIMKPLLQQLEAKIYASNPELKQLGVGCEVKIPKHVLSDELTIESIVNTHKSKDYFMLSNNCLTHKNIFEEIIGKPPTLVDVRNWIRTLKKEYRDEIDTMIDLILDWNNSIYLRDQDEALINFLNNLDNGL